jgi:hypothetical protein
VVNSLWRGRQATPRASGTWEPRAIPKKKGALKPINGGRVWGQVELTQAVDELASLMQSKRMRARIVEGAAVHRNSLNSSARAASELRGVHERRYGTPYNRRLR